MVLNEMVCGVTTLLDGKKKKNNSDNEALWYHGIVVWEKNRMRTMNLLGVTELSHGNK